MMYLMVASKLLLQRPHHCSLLEGELKSRSLKDSFQGKWVHDQSQPRWPSNCWRDQRRPGRSPTFIASHRPWFVLPVLLTEVPRHSFLDLINLLEPLTELREGVMFTGILPRMLEMKCQACRKGRSSHASWCATLQLPMSTPNPVLRDFFT
jgi:hypothetical protein